MEQRCDTRVDDAGPRWTAQIGEVIALFAVQTTQSDEVPGMGETGVQELIFLDRQQHDPVPCLV